LTNEPIYEYRRVDNTKTKIFDFFHSIFVYVVMTPLIFLVIYPSLLLAFEIYDLYRKKIKKNNTNENGKGGNQSGR